MTNTPLPPDARLLSGPLRWLTQALAALCLVLAVLGLVMPLMPSVPFLALAAWATARSSPRLHAWLVAHPRFGVHLRDWSEAGVVPRHAKWMSTAMMGGSALSMPLVVPPGWTVAMLAMWAVMAVLLLWLWLRPERRRDAA